MIIVIMEFSCRISFTRGYESCSHLNKNLPVMQSSSVHQVHISILHQEQHLASVQLSVEHRYEVMAISAVQYLVTGSTLCLRFWNSLYLSCKTNRADEGGATDLPDSNVC